MSTFGEWTPLVAFLATFVLLLLAKRWITMRLQELSIRWVGDPDIALVLYFVVVLPGVVVHELSHWFTAKALGVRVTGFSIGPVRKGKSRRVSLGSIRVGQVDPIRASLIGVAPLVGGTLVILAIGYLVLDIGELRWLLEGQGSQALLEGLQQLMQVADFWLWLYLIFSISNAMLPSPSDMNTVRPVLIFLGAATAVILIVIGVPAIPASVVSGVNRIAGYLATAFGLTLAVDLVFALIIGSLLLGTRWLQQY